MRAAWLRRRASESHGTSIFALILHGKFRPRVSGLPIRAVADRGDGDDGDSWRGKLGVIISVVRNRPSS